MRNKTEVNCSKIFQSGAISVSYRQIRRRRPRANAVAMLRGAPGNPLSRGAVAAVRIRTKPHVCTEMMSPP